MDPFSLALGGITVCQVASKIIQFGISYAQSIQDLPADVQALVSEITVLKAVLAEVCSHLQDGSNGSSINADLLEAPIMECKEQIEELHAFLEKSQGSGSRLRNLRKTLKWPMKEQDTRDWINRMERYKSIFMLALTQVGL